MSLWFIILGAFLVGSFCLGLVQRRNDPEQTTNTLIHVWVVFFAYLAGTGILVAINIFFFDLVDSFFQDTRLYVYRILYWPAGLLSFLPLLFAGMLVLTATMADLSRRKSWFLILLLTTLLCFEVTALVDNRPIVLVTAQALVFVLFSALVWRRR